MITEPSDPGNPEPGVTLSLLVCSTHTRYRTFGRAIQDQLWPQYEALPPADQDRVEILILVDNKKMMLGEKRNVMVDAAQGRYVQFIDDDDRIEPDLIRSVLAGIDESGADVITFLCSVSINGAAPKVCRYSKRYGQDQNTAREYRRLPNHICCIRREVAIKATFPNLLYGEDSGYSKLLLPHIGTEHHIDRVLYHYDYNSETTETQQARRARVRTTRQAGPPVVDVVILSNAKTAKLRRMTQHAVDTCLAGANGLSLNITVMEQTGARYQNATTVYNPGPFNYNRSANAGAVLGTAPWVMIANNDLVFHDGWLHQLIAADHPVVSPLNPGDSRQRDMIENTAGPTNGRHFSGWCFMIKRDLFERIGGFDESVAFWCSDDATVEQVKAAGVLPMLVPGSVVRHLGSVTLKAEPNADDLTWRQVDAFNRKYGATKFVTDPRFIAWKQRQPMG